MVARSVLQRNNTVHKLLFKSSHGHSGNDAAPLRTGYGVFQLSCKAVNCYAKTHFHRIIKTSFPSEQLFLPLAKPSIFKYTAFDALFNRPCLNGTKTA